MNYYSKYEDLACVLENEMTNVTIVPMMKVKGEKFMTFYDF